MIALKRSKYFNSIVSMCQEFIEKSKIMIEEKKLLRELKNKYQELGKYVTWKKETKSVGDLSHDSEYLQKINEIIITVFKKIFNTTR